MSLCTTMARPKKTPTEFLRLFVLMLALLPPAIAHAHSETGTIGGFVSGFRHPLTGLDHIAAMVAVGIWGAYLGAPAMWLLPVIFPMVMAFGGMLGLMGLPLPGAEIGIALSALVLGAVILAEARPPLAASLAVVAAFAIFHGHAHGTELPENASGLAYSIGFVTATGLLHAAGIGIGLIHRWPAGRLALRGAGGAIAAAGPVFLWLALA